MDNMTNSDWVRSQYADKSKLQTRISIHEKYSTNPQSYADWLFSQYPIHAGDNVLELGCGTGSMWKGRIERLPFGCHMTLTDISPAMVDAAREQLADVRGVKFECTDIQNLPYPDASFDVVIANMMLYHVPDIHKALREVRRVLKQGGSFFCATYGAHGIVEYLSDLLSAYGVADTTNKSFTLQNGYSILREVFSEAQKYTYPDALAVTDIDDMLAYIRSLSTMTGLHTVPDSVLREILTAHMVDGVLHVPKEYGMFAAM